MNKKIQEETVPDKWRSDLVRDYRFPPLGLTWQALPRKRGQADVLLTANSGSREAEYTGLYLRDATPRQLAETSLRVEEMAKAANRLPLIVAPYLSEENLIDLETRNVSALDLSGNGTLKAPDSFSVFRTGLPNRFTSSRPLKNVYRGASSLVARAFLLKPSYDTVGELQEEITRRQGVISLSTISKAVTELESDIIVRREKQPSLPQARSLRLLDPKRLLTRLAENYERPPVRRTFSGKVDMSLPELQTRLWERAQQSGVRLIATGIGSATRYAALAMENTLYVYTDSLPSLLEGLPVTETRRFPNLNIQETDDRAVYFDPRKDDTAFPWASPITVYLEMNAGEARLRQSATQIQEQLLKSSEGALPR